MEIKTMANETLTSVFSDIADAIRAKGVAGQMKPTEMPTKIADIPSGGSGDPRYEVDQNGQLVKKDFDITWFNDLTSVPLSGLDSAYQLTNVGVDIQFNSLSSVGNNGMRYCFIGCNNIQTVSLSSLSNLGNDALLNCFQDCKNISSINFDSLESINATRGMCQTFMGCSKLASISFPSLSSIGGVNGMMQCFSGCTNLSSASFPNLVTVSGTSTLRLLFQNNTKLKNVYLPKLSSVTESTGIMQCFIGCSALELVDFHLATSVPSISDNTFQDTNYTFQIVVPDELYDTWITATNWSARASQIVKYSEYTPAS